MSFLSTIFGKKQSPAPEVVKRNKQPDVYNFENDDQSMNAAMEKAQHTLQYFRTSLVSPKPHQQYFSLKAKIEDGDQSEHIWLNEVSFDDSGNYFGVIGNEPLYVKTVKIGHKVGIPDSRVSDWMIIENGRLIGGYTIRVIRDKMSDKEKTNFDRGIGMFIDEGVDYYEHNFSTPEGAILCLEDAYTEKDIDKAIACKDFDEEGKLMLTKMDTIRALADNEDIIKQTGEVLRLSFIKSMQDHGFPNFTGIYRAFPEKKYLNENLVLVTEVCFNPDRTKTKQKLFVIKKGDQWKVLSLSND